MRLKRKAIQVLLVYLPVMAVVFAGYYAEGRDPVDILVMIAVSTVIAVVLMSWIVFVVDRF